MSTYRSTYNRIDPFRDLFGELNQVEQPGRYVGGEFGRIVRFDQGLFRVALAFPDLYEIGMSNTAIKLLYGLLNTLPEVACERVFVPAPDFEAVLRNRNVPLYTLETGTPLNHCDLLAITLSYELLATNLLTLLSCGNIPVNSSSRGPGDPLVVIGGPGSTNPLPYGRFIDAAFIGEAEEEFPSLVENLASHRLRGASRDDLLKLLRDHPAIWYPGREKPVRRAIWNSFGRGESRTAKQQSLFDGVRPVPSSFGAGFPIPSIPVIQDHGVIEIMRGCPQGCRFCQAGVFYRPYRMKSVSRIMEEADWLVHGLGYRELSLSSLSSGDYGPLEDMMDRLNTRYGRIGVSLQLPSLRVDSFTLPILERLHTVRRAGITFAVESAGEAQQAWTNKLVPLEKVVAIAREARAGGWRRAKLYFMIGLPGPDGAGEARRILDYVEQLRKQVPLEFVLNIGTFIPKPHTPFQWEPQYTPMEATNIFREIRAGAPRGVTVRTHDPWMSWLEGILARGDETVGAVIEDAYARGARLDAWTDYLNIEAWKEAVASHPGSDQSLRGFALDHELPWEVVKLGVSRQYLLRERTRAYEGLLTGRCDPDCTDRCGICSTATTVRDLKEPIDRERSSVEDRAHQEEPIRGTARENRNSGPAVTRHQEPHGRNCQLLIEYRKRGGAAFLPHLAVVRIFERLGHRIALPMELSSGHHPKPKMSFGQPLPIGVESDMEIGVINVHNTIQLENYSQAFFREGSLPDGMSINRLALVRHQPGEPRIPAPMQLYAGSVFHLWAADESRDSLEALTCFLNTACDQGALLDESNQTFDVSYPGRRLVLPRQSPGLGRLLKDNDVRGKILSRRISIYTHTPQGRTLQDQHEGERQPLFEWYLNLAEAFARQDLLEKDLIEQAPTEQKSPFQERS